MVLEILNSTGSPALACFSDCHMCISHFPTHQSIFHSLILFWHSTLSIDSNAIHYWYREANALPSFCYEERRFVSALTASAKVLMRPENFSILFPTFKVHLALLDAIKGAEYVRVGFHSIKSSLSIEGSSGWI